MRDILNDNEQNSEKIKENLDYYNHFIETIISFLQNESNERPKRINIFTTNYDLMFEKTFEKILNKKNVFFNDGSTGLLTCNFKCNNFMKGIVVLFCLKSVTLNSYEILSVKYKIKTINPVFV